MPSHGAATTTDQRGASLDPCVAEARMNFRREDAAHLQASVRRFSAVQQPLPRHMCELVRVATNRVQGPIRKGAASRRRCARASNNWRRHRRAEMPSRRQWRPRNAHRCAARIVVQGERHDHGLAGGSGSLCWRERFRSVLVSSANPRISCRSAFIVYRQSSITWSPTVLDHGLRAGSAQVAASGTAKGDEPMAAQAIASAESVESRQTISNSFGHVGLTGDLQQEIGIIGNGERVQRDRLQNGREWRRRCAQ